MAPLHVIEKFPIYTNDSVNLTQKTTISPLPSFLDNLFNNNNKNK